MNSRSRHAASPARQGGPRRVRLLLRAGLTVTAAGAVVGGAAGMASAASSTNAVRTDAPQQDGGAQQSAPSRLETPLGSYDTSILHQPVGRVTQGLGVAAHSAVTPVENLRLNPWAGSAIDPANNAVGTRVADFRPISTEPVTRPLTKGGSVNQLVGHAAGLLGH